MDAPAAKNYYPFIFYISLHWCKKCVKLWSRSFLAPTFLIHYFLPIIFTFSLLLLVDLNLIHNVSKEISRQFRRQCKTQKWLTLVHSLLSVGKIIFIVFRLYFINFGYQAWSALKEKLFIAAFSFHHFICFLNSIFIFCFH